MISGKVQTEQSGHDRIVEQLSYLIDEAIALRYVLEDFPDDILTARPYEGEPSVADLLATLVERERGVRIPNVKTLVSSGDNKLLPAASVPPHSVDPESAGVTETLNDLISVRRELLSVVADIEGQSWENAGPVPFSDCSGGPESPSSCDPARTRVTAYWLARFHSAVTWFDDRRVGWEQSSRVGALRGWSPPADTRP